MKKVRIPKRDQGMSLVLKKKGNPERGIVVEPCLKQNLNSNPETDSRTTMQTGTSTNSGTGP